MADENKTPAEAETRTSEAEGVNVASRQTAEASKIPIDESADEPEPKSTAQISADAEGECDEKPSCSDVSKDAAADLNDTTTAGNSPDDNPSAGSFQDSAAKSAESSSEGVSSDQVSKDAAIQAVNETEFKVKCPVPVQEKKSELEAAACESDKSAAENLEDITAKPYHSVQVSKKDVVGPVVTEGKSVAPCKYDSKAESPSVPDQEKKLDDDSSKPTSDISKDDCKSDMPTAAGESNQEVSKLIASETVTESKPTTVSEPKSAANSSPPPDESKEKSATFSQSDTKIAPTTVEAEKPASSTCLLDLDGNPYVASSVADPASKTQNTTQASAKDASRDEPVSPSVEPKLATAEMAAPTVPTLETPKEDQVHGSSEKKIDSAVNTKAEKEPSNRAKNTNESTKEAAALKETEQTDTVQQSSDKPSQKGNADKKSDSPSKKTKTSSVTSREDINKVMNIADYDDDKDEDKQPPQDRPIIDPASYHLKICTRRKKQHKFNPINFHLAKNNPSRMSSENITPMERMSRKPTDNYMNPTDRMNRMMMMDNMMSRNAAAPGDDDRGMDNMNSFNRMMSSDKMKMSMMDGEFGGMSGARMNDRMKMMAMMDGEFGGMSGAGMSDRMKMMVMTGNKFSPNDQMMISPTSRRMALGYGGGMDFKSGSMGSMGARNGPMMSNKTPGNLQELREMMFRDMKMDRMGSQVFDRMGSGSNKDCATFDRKGSKGGDKSINPPGSKVSEEGTKKDEKCMASELLNRLGSKGSVVAKNDDKEVPTVIDRLGSTGTGKGSRGSPSIGEDSNDYLKGPILPTPAEIKPSFKKQCKDISFSPLDRLDRDLMKRMMAFQDSSFPGMSEGPLGGLPSLPSNISKRKYSDFSSAYSPRSPNPKKSFLERHRLMDLEMKGHLEEAMANFGRFQRKYSGGSGGLAFGSNVPSMMGDRNPSMMGVGGNLPSMFGDNAPSMFSSGVGAIGASMPTGMPLGTIPAKKEIEEKTKSRKSKKKDKAKKKASKSTKASKNDKVKPKRPFSAYNIFFQLEREAILAHVTEGRDPKEDLLEVEYNEKVKSGEIEHKPLGPQPPRNPAIHEPLDPSAPDRYKDLRLEKMWFRAGCKAKRKHRKTEGASVPFLELTKLISRRWANVDNLAPEIKAYCTKLAKKELEDYKIKLNKYKATAAADAHQQNSDDSSAISSTDEDEEQPLPPKRKRPKQSSNQQTSVLKPDSQSTSAVNPGGFSNSSVMRPGGLNSSHLDFGSQTPNVAREAMFDPKFSSRFTDLSKMDALLGTPKDFLANSMGSSAAGNSGLPPPPLFGDTDGPQSDMERRMAAMAGAENKFTSGHLMNMGGGGGNGALGNRAAALADARLRMQMDMARMGDGSMGGLGGMSNMGMNNMFSRGGGGMSDRFSNMPRNMMMDPDMQAMMRYRSMEQFGTGTNVSQNDQNFDTEVERFLYCLGDERRRGSMFGADGGGGGMGRMGMGGDFRMPNMSTNQGINSSMSDRLMMMDRMANSNRGGGPGSGSGNDMLPYSRMPNMTMGSDNPQLPEFGDMSKDSNNRSASRSSK